MPYQYLTASTENQLGVITLNRPDRRNALSLGLMLELIACLDEFAGVYEHPRHHPRSRRQGLQLGPRFK